MYLVKKFILTSSGVAVAILGRISLACGAVVLGAQCLAQIGSLQKYAILNNIFIIEQSLEKPVVKILHANVPMLVDGIDIAPYVIFVAFFLLWISCEFELHRLAALAFKLNEERSHALSQKAAAKTEQAARETARQAQKAAIAQALAQAETRASQEKAPEPSAKPLAVVPIAGSQREQLLELYAQTKKTLEEQKKNLSFLAIDVVNSTGMKQGEDSSLAERDFRQYKKLVERVITANKGLKAAWTPDGVMICFASVQNAVQAAQDLIKSLDHFNRNVKTIKSEFKIRCGINAGKVLFDDTVPMEEMTDRNIDIAGHMQKYAEANTIYIGAHAIEGMRTQYGFRPAQKQVDGCEVYEWHCDEASEAPSLA